MSISPLLTRFRSDPVAFGKLLWPHVEFFPKQVSILESVRDNEQTFVTAGHKLGKDFVAGFVMLWYFLVHHPVRVVTTSVKDDHLRVLWGECGRFIQTAKYPLDSKDGGPLVVTHREIRKVVNGSRCPYSYMIGLVSEKAEGLAGHHAPYTLALIDEASGVQDLAFERIDTWARKMVAIGNPYAPTPGCTFFKRAVLGGDIDSFIRPVTQVEGSTHAASSATA